MPRQARVYPENGLSHITIRGISRQFLFETKYDYLFFLKLLEECSKQTNVVVIAYCLMENHVHLLIQDEEQNMSQFMKKIMISFSMRFNKRYDRVGHLFQNRFKNEPIVDLHHLLEAIRYIINNPAKAGICDARNYAWSSYREYWAKDSFVDTSIIKLYYPTAKEYVEFITGEADFESKIDYEDEIEKTNDELAHEKLKKLLNVESGMDLQKMTKEERNKAISLLRKNHFSIRRIERLTGISRGIIQRCGVCEKKSVNSI